VPKGKDVDDVQQKAFGETWVMIKSAYRQDCEHRLHGDGFLSLIGDKLHQWRWNLAQWLYCMSIAVTLRGLIGVGPEGYRITAPVRSQTVKTRNIAITRIFSHNHESPAILAKFSRIPLTLALCRLHSIHNQPINKSAEYRPRPIFQNLCPYCVDYI